jgi:phage shock protein PspC (stress-responsive transcriptional regulator)
MKKTISINLSNQNFSIEEDAYEKLASYLKSIKNHCGGADTDEVVADIENSMADKLKSSLSPYKEIITLEDIESLIKIMGTTEDFDREVGASNESEDDEESLSDNKTKRKLYRDADNAVIGGVCAGLGAYFDIDPVLFRVIFFALVFAGGSAFPIYILLWIAMPEAKTAHQKLEMQGQAPTIAAFKNLAKTGKQIQENWKKRWQKRSALGKVFSLPLIIINGLFLAIKKVWRALWPICLLCIGVFLTVFSLIGLAAISIGALFMLLFNNPVYKFSFIPITELTAVVPYTWLIITGFLSLAIPAILFIIGGLAIIRKKNFLSFTAGSILVGAWMAAGIIFCALCLRYAPELKQKFDNYYATEQVKQVVDLAGIEEIEAYGNRLNIFVSADTSTPPVISGRQIDLSSLEIKREDKKLIITQQNYQPEATCINCHLSSVQLAVATSTKLKISALDGADIFDETAPIPEPIIEDEDLPDYENSTSTVSE